MRFKKTDVIYGRIRGLIRDHLKRRKTISAYDLPQPRKLASLNLRQMAAFGEIVKVRPATIGRNSKPAVWRAALAIIIFHEAFWLVGNLL